MNISGGQNQLFVACNCHRSERCPIIDPDLLVNVMEVKSSRYPLKDQGGDPFLYLKDPPLQVGQFVVHGM